ncbi:MAG TPA: DUF1801 domain-containing protein [Candidatus Limnocylindrales bacterium]
MVAKSTISPEAFLASYPDPMRAIAETLRAIVRRAVPSAIEGVRPGWRLIGYDAPVDRRTRYFAYVAPELEHVHLGFEHGIAMDDPDGVLLGSTRRVRWLTFRPGDILDEASLAVLLHEAVRVAAMSRAERLWRALDRDAGRLRPT